MSQTARLDQFEGTEVPVYVHAEELKHAFYCAKTGDGDHAYLRANYDDVPLGPTLPRDRPAWRESQRWLKALERRHDAPVFYGHDPDDFDRLRQGLP